MYFNLRLFVLKKLGFTAFGIGFLSLLVPSLIFILWLKRRRPRARFFSLTESEGELIGDEDDLRAAEKALMVSDAEIREALLQEHEPYGRFSTLHGYDQATMDRLVGGLREKGIQCETFFQDTAPVGVASVIGRRGFHELYVLREQKAEADRLLDPLTSRRPSE